MKKGMMFMAALVVLMLGAVSVVSAATVTLDWDAVTTNTDGTTCIDLAGYNVYQSSSPGGTYLKVASTLASTTHYSTTIAVPNNTAITKYYVVTAFDLAGNESVYSNEVGKSFFGIDTIAPAIPKNLR